MQATTSEDKQVADKGQDSADVVAAETAPDHAQFSDAGTKPPVGTSAPAGAAHAPSASDQAFADGGGERGFNSSGGGAGGSGQPLPDDVKGKFEASLGTDLSGVRVHTDAKSSEDTKSAGAKAVAVGSDIHFAHGNYDPHGQQGQELLAHEVAHTVQQKHATPQAQHKAEHVAPATHGAEADADQAASAMVSGQKASVTPVAQQRPHAKEAEWMAPIRASLKNGDWGDVALRLNGLNLDDMYTVVKGFTLGQRNHVRGSAQVVMAGWPEHVTETIDKVAAENGETGNKAAADYYAGYERAFAAAKSGKGSWAAVAQGLAGMSAWDQDDRLKKLDWFDLQALRGATDNAALLKQIDKADEARAKRSRDAYAAALAAQDWGRVAAQLNGFDADGIASSINEIADRPNGIHELGYLRAAAVRLMPTYHQRVTSVIDSVLSGRGEAPAQEIPYVAAVELPDVTDDTRPLAGTDLSDFGGNAKIADFAAKLAASFGERKSQKDKKPETQETQTATELAKLRASFKSTGPLAIGNMGYKTFAGYAHDWMSEMREGVDAQFKLGQGRWLDAPTFQPDQLVELDKSHSQGDGGQRVHPFLNEFCTALGSGFKASTYKNHGGEKWAPFCLDLFPQVPRDDRGLYQREPMMEFYERINAAVNGLGGDWMSCYNDATLAQVANERLGSNRIAYTGVDGTGNWHGALKLHVHLYLTPPQGAPGAARSAPTLDPSKEGH